MLAMADELQKVQTKHASMHFKDAAEKYIDSKRNILFPTTIRWYNSTIKTISRKFKEIKQLKQYPVQGKFSFRWKLLTK